MTKTEAVAYLRDRGFHAFERDWAIGETIGVAANPKTQNGITVYQKLVYIVRCQEGWIIEAMNPVPCINSERKVMSLEAACACAEAILSEV